MCFKKLEYESFKLIDRRNIFCISININPIPNSTAESTKKKKVRDIKFTLSNNAPTLRTIRYKVIHKSSAVKSRCSAVVTLELILIKSRKNIIIYKFTSPKCRS